MKRKEWLYPGYQCYDNQDEEYEVKINKLIQFGEIYDNIVVNGSEYLKMDFIYDETLDDNEKEYLSGLFYDIRSRMIHGDFDKLKKELLK